LYSIEGKTVYVPGHRGLVGSALVRRLARENCTILTAGREELDLRRQGDVETFLRNHRPDAMIIPAAKVGGIVANNTWPATFIVENLQIETNLIASAHEVGVERLVFLGSSCVYPKFAEQPIREDSLLTGPLEETNQWYAVAKIAGVKMVQAHRRQHGRSYISAMPTNLYGPGDNFDPTASHVLPALIRRTDEAKSRGDDALTIWGSGTPRREFMHSDDCADALVFLLKHYDDEAPVNVGVGADMSILELAELVAEIVGYTGRIERDLSKPDGTPRKLLSVQKLTELGWSSSIALRDGIAQTYKWYRENIADVRGAAKVR